MYEDTYFLNSQEALRVASQQNKLDDGRSLQVCYYDGQKIESDLINLIHLPIDNLLEGLVYGRQRIPTKIDYTGLDVSLQVRIEVVSHFNSTVEDARQYRNQLNIQYLKELQNAKLDFSEPLRFFIPANSRTTVMQYISKNIADILVDMGYKVMYDLQRGTEDLVSFKHLYEFNPHVSININHLNNTFLSDDVFNFVWFQDAMQDITDNKQIYIRERDFVFHLIDGLDVILKNKGIKSTLQPFMISDKEYKQRDSIKKEKKIVFIGSSYLFKLDDLKKDREFEKVYSEAVNIFEKTSCFKNIKHEDGEVRYLMEKYNKSEKYIGNIYAYLSRDYCIEKLCSIDTDYEIEVYGYGWEENNKIKPYFKGKVEHGEEISRIYNSATYGFCPGAYVMMQRTLECAFSGTIPLVLDVRADKQNTYSKKLEEGICFFKLNELESILTKEAPKDKNFEHIVEQYSYKHFIKKILNILTERLAS
ncbi:hypothetical protein [Sulfurimonas sp.]